MKNISAFQWMVIWLVISAVPSVRASASDGPIVPNEIAKLLADDRRNGDQFGISVGIHNDLTIVGAWESDYLEAGEGGGEAGAAYLFDLQGTQLHKLVASDRQGGNNFGLAVAVNEDFAVVGAPRNRAAGTQAGAAYVFDVNTGQELRKLTHSELSANDEFGFSVALEENIALVGAWNENVYGLNSGAAYLFDVTTGESLHRLVPNDYGFLFGNAVALSGSKAIVGAYGNPPGDNRGAAYVFDVETGQQLFKLTADDGTPFDEFGRSVAVDGPLAIIGAPGETPEGAAYLFNIDTGQQLAKFVGSNDSNNNFGWSVAIKDGVIAVGASDASAGSIAPSGSVILFDLSTNDRIAKLIASDEATGHEFGWSIAMRDENTIVVGARNAGSYSSQTVYGAAYIFGVPEPSSLVLLICSMSAVVLFAPVRRLRSSQRS